MKATLAKTAMGLQKSKILDAEYGTCELVFEVFMTPKQYGEFIECYNDKEIKLEVKDGTTKNIGFIGGMLD